MGGGLFEGSFLLYSSVTLVEPQLPGIVLEVDLALVDLLDPPPLYWRGPSHLRGS